MTRLFQPVRPALALAALILSSQGASAQVLQALSDATIRETLCVGLGCPDDPTPILPDNASGGLHIMDNRTRIDFVDTSTTFPGNDWALITNDISSSGANYFSIQDTTAFRIPFRIDAGAPTNGFRLASDGDVGLGTALPQTDLHVVGSSSAGLRLNATDTGTVMGNEAFELSVSAGGLSLIDVGNFSWVPFRVALATPPGALELLSGGAVINADNRDYDFTLWGDTAMILHSNAANSRLGLGTFGPETALHLQRNDGAAAILVENTALSTAAAREMFKMRNNGGSYFTLENTDSNTSWFFTHEQAAPNRFIIADAVPDGAEMSLTAGGDLTVQGNFISGATTLNVPDYVFGPDYALRPLAEVAAFIGTNRHLPDVPSAAEIAADGLDLTDMQMALLKKVEELTLYTLEQEDRIARLEAALAAR
ncbi:hypothetical protein ACOXXX_18275 [Thalassococcus sp. BH17M4-6]|uniref:hypothetical protein n=1 Tax=Thalassococcus sp. BH17M4-6 TaxID=3413148 RepID=UPI003BEDA81A